MLATQAQLQDGDHRLAKGLLLRVRGGSASFVLRFTSPVTHRRREMGLGPLDMLSPRQPQVDAALDRAAKLRIVILAGRDPIDEREARRVGAKVAQLRAKGTTVLRVLRLWYDANEHRWHPRYAKQVAFRIENDAPAWLLAIPLMDLRSVDVVRGLMAMTVSQQRKDHMRQRLDWAIEWFMHRGELSANAAGVRRIARGRFGAVE